MKTIKYTVDRGFRRAGEVRSEEDAVAENLIWRGFAEETDEEADASTGEAHAVAQYHPEGAEADVQEHGGTQPLPAELNAPGTVGSNAEVGSNAPSAAGSDAPSDATNDAPSDATNDAPSDAASTASATAPATRSRSTKTSPVTSPVAGLGTISEGETNPVTASETANAAEVETAAEIDGDGDKNVAEIKDEDKDKAAEGDQSGQTS